MSSPLLDVITSPEAAVRNQPLEALLRGATLEDLLAHAAELDQFRRGCTNLYQRVRALFFLYAIHRFHMPLRVAATARGGIPYAGYEHYLNRRFEEALDIFLAAQAKDGPSDQLSSALAAASRTAASSSAAAFSRADHTPMTVFGTWSSPTKDGSSIGGFSGNSPLRRSTSTELLAMTGALSRKRRASTNNKMRERITSTTPVTRPIRNFTIRPA